ncbi:hypothetical protein LTR70_002449 [Exophiala xenobiotica]|uniref:Peptidase S8/S53 domain-containing protein n=1 Tax=Lithohypha guttulata TaxID=1690604 RepID=A0ABR0KL65_9EURO|nr:hypothetical protein LTR24_001446 [Lithohypha guttulata]KAK5325477.1 hypothetical protein LTR70_002449 [Exophiala xenobiotica]
MRLTINGMTADVELSDTATSLKSMDKDGQGTDYILIKTRGPLTNAEKKELGDKEVEILEYVGDDTYLCHYVPDNLSELQAKNFVVGVSFYQETFRVSDTLNASLRAKDRPQGQDKAVTLVLHEARTEQDFIHVVQLIAERAETKVEAIQIDEGTNTLRLKIDPAKVEDLASLDVVKVVDETVPKVLSNDCARKILGFSAPEQPIPFPFQGEGQTIAIADTGLDNGNPKNINPAFKGRIKELISINRVQTKRTDDVHGHGTHVCGSAVGAVMPSAAVYKNVQGIAPKASLVMQSLYYSMDNPIRVPTGSKLQDLFLDPYKRHDARIHSNSWGDEFYVSTGPQAYNIEECKLVDDLVHANPDLLIIIAAGNDGKLTDGPTITGIPACKNVLTVGATESYRPSFNGIPLKTKLSENDPSEISWYSSRGPTVELRIKSDVLAPGTPILSNKSSAMPQKLPANGMEPSDDPQYCFRSGTSMATPLVAGCAAALREYLKASRMDSPPAALMKALLINGAYSVHHSHNAKEGFGIVNIANSLVTKDGKDGAWRIGRTFTDAKQDESIDVDIPQTVNQSSAEGNSKTHYTEVAGTLRVTPPSRRGVTLKATMVYTDRGGAQLQNHLNLQVTASDGSFRNGNRGSSSLTDGNNNVEQVIWKGIAPGKATIKVTCVQLSLKDDTQDYALVWRLIPNED